LSNPELCTFSGQKLTRGSKKGRLFCTNRLGWEVYCGKNDQWEYHMLTTQRSTSHESYRWQFCIHNGMYYILLNWRLWNYFEMSVLLWVTMLQCHWSNCNAIFACIYIYINPIGINKLSSNLSFVPKPYKYLSLN
jgi:hypothetical protein